MNADELVSKLAQFTGSDEYYILGEQFILTEGTKFLAEKADCFWLYDCIGSFLNNIPADERFVVITLKRVGVGAQLEMSDDIPVNRTYGSKRILFTNFPLDSVKLYMSRFTETRWILILPQEY